MSKLPQYFDEVQVPKKFFGTLKRKEDRWIVEAEPHVTQLLKRLFPLTQVAEGGVAHFPINKRYIGELNWFMMRYPLNIEQPGLWQKDLDMAKEHYLLREEVKENISKTEPHPKFNGTLFDFQKQGLSFMMNNKRCLLADEMGLGKTIQALALISKSEFPVIIVVPPHLISQWTKEIKKFLGEKVKIHVPKGKNNKKMELEERDADIYLCGYHLLHGWKDELIKLNCDLIIFDEVQELRHMGTLKYEAAVEVASGKEYTIGLSGTPIYNYGTEIYNIMNVIEPMCLGDWEFFTKEWCGGWGWVIVKEVAMLGKYLYDEGLMLRRRKEDCLLELPPKRHITEMIDLDDAMYLKLIKKSVEIAEKIPTLLTDAEKKTIGLMTLQAVNNARRASGIAKAGHVCDFVKTILDTGEPILLFAFHHDVVDIYMRLLAQYSPLCVTGRETQEEKNDAVQAFMNERTNCLIVNMRTTAGLNLQRAKCVVFGELDWSPAVHKQAEDRIHRIGQKDSVLAYYLVAPTAADEEIASTLRLKDSQFIGIMHDKTSTKEDEELSQQASNKFMAKLMESLRSGKKGEASNDTN